MMDLVHPHIGPTVHGGAIYARPMAVNNHSPPMDPIQCQQQQFGRQGTFTVPLFHMQQQYGYREQTRHPSVINLPSPQKTEPTSDAHASDDVSVFRSCFAYHHRLV